MVDQQHCISHTRLTCLTLLSESTSWSLLLLSFTDPLATAAHCASPTWPLFVESPQAVHQDLEAGHLPTKEAINTCFHALEVLQHRLGHMRLSSHAASYLVTFLFRPFMAHLLACSQQQGYSCLAVLVLALTHCVLHVLQQLKPQLLQQQQLGSAHDPAQQQEERQCSMMVSAMLKGLARGHMYQVDSTAADWLSSADGRSGFQGLKQYLASRKQLRTPLPTPAAVAAATAAADGIGSSSSNTSSSLGRSSHDACPGVQHLINLLKHTDGSTSSHVDAVICLCHVLLTTSSSSGDAAVTAAFREADLSPLWQHWLRGPLIQAVQPVGLMPEVVTLTASDFAAAVGSKAYRFTPKACSSSTGGDGRPASTSAQTQLYFAVTWTDGSKQTVQGLAVPQRQPVQQLLLGPGSVLAQSTTQQQLCHLQQLLLVLEHQQQQAGQDVDISSLNDGGCSSSTNSSNAWQHQQVLHMATCVTQLVLFALAEQNNSSSSSSSSRLLSGVLTLVSKFAGQQGPDSAVHSAGPSLGQQVGLQLACMLLQPLEHPAASAAVYQAIEPCWPPSLQSAKDWLASADRTGRQSPSADVHGSSGGGSGAFAAALQQLPQQQQLVVLQLLADVLESPVGQISSPELLSVEEAATAADVLCQAWHKQQQQQDQQDPGFDTKSHSSSTSWHAWGVRLLQLLDGGSSKVYMHLLTRVAALTEYTKAETGDDHQQQQGEQLNAQKAGSAALQLLQATLSTPEATHMVTTALRKLLAQPHDMPAAVAALVALLPCQGVESDGAAATAVEVMLELTGPSASLQLLAALAGHGSSSATKFLFRCWVQAFTSAGAGAPSAAEQNAQPQLLLLLVRLLPHVPDNSLAASQLRLCLQEASPSGPEAASSNHIWCLSLHPREVSLLLRLLQKLDAAAATHSNRHPHQDTPADEWPAPRCFMRLYVSGLLQHLHTAQPNQATTAAATHQLMELVELLSSQGQHTTAPQQPMAAAVASAVHLELLHYIGDLAKLLAADDAADAAAAGACLMQLLPGLSQMPVQEVLARAAATSGTADGSSSLHKAASNSTAVTAFFSPEQRTSQCVQATITSEDFVVLAKKLVSHIKSSEAAAAAGAGMRLPQLAPVKAGQQHLLASAGEDGAAASTIAAGLVLTPTTLDNLHHILAVVEHPSPLLLEGPTGVGKSATVSEAARQLGKRLVRFNMSNNITESDLLARCCMKADAAGGTTFEQQLQPFAAAFASGDWLLLDELNLAPDAVLQCIEQALDTGVSVFAICLWTGCA